MHMTQKLDCWAGEFVRQLVGWMVMYLIFWRCPGGFWAAAAEGTEGDKVL